jgi:hypothetical protein
MTKTIPFGNVYGFGNNRSIRRLGKRFIIIESYYSQGMRKSMFGITPAYVVSKVKSSDDISGLGNIKYFAQYGAYLLAQDDTGAIYQEATPGALDFGAAVHSPGGNGSGMIGDQQGRLLYANKSDNTQLGMFAGSSWSTGATDDWKTGFESWSHPMDLYEDLVIIGNKFNVAVLYSDDSLNLSALELPSNVSVSAVRTGQKGFLIGANLGFDGILILWDGNATRSLAPWIWTRGQVLAIERYHAGWLVVTQKEILYTNGYTATSLFEFIDSPFSFSNWMVNPQGILVVNEKLIILQKEQTIQQTSEFGRTKPGVYIFDISMKTFEYAPVHTLNTITVVPQAAFLTKSYSQSIVLGYRDDKLAKNYISTLGTSGPSAAIYISEAIAAGATEKSVEQVALNFGVSTEKVDAQPLTFTVSAKVYNFKRPLWSRQQTNASTGSTSTVRVDATVANMNQAKAGDEVTILQGVNAGQIRHISTIANAGTNTEMWTLDSTLPNVTETGIWMNVQPFVQLDKKQTFTNLSEMKRVVFNASTSVVGKRFLVKVVFENMSGVQPEMHDPLFQYKDLGIQT